MPLINPLSVVGGISKSVTDLLKGEHAIPPYQRDYVWQEKTVAQLWDDLTAHYTRFAVNEQLPNPEGYFLGAMVFIESPPQPFEIVDGQQRLTTLSTVVSILYDAIQRLPLHDETRIGFEQRLREMLAKFDGTSWVSNLAFADPDLQKFFLESCFSQRDHAAKLIYWGQTWCQGKLERKRSPFARIQVAIETGYAKLDAFLNKQTDLALQLIRLQSFLRLVTECVVVLRIAATSYSNAYSIFESLNNRGIPLSQADLIKNELLKIAPPSDRDDITDNWTTTRQTVDTFESVQLPDLLHYSYLSRHGRVKAKELYAAAKAKLTAPSEAKKYSEETLTDAQALDAVSENFNADWTPETLNMLKDIKTVLNVKLCYPYLIAAFRKYESDPSAFEGHVRVIMNFAFRYMKVLEGSIEALANTVSDACLKINAGEPLSNIQTLFRGDAPDTEFEKYFESVSFQSTKLAYFAVYYLERVQLSGAIPLPHGADQNLEHIMPKTPTATHWPIATAEKATNPEIFKDYLWRVGNLIPLPASINKSLKNREISYKINNGTASHYNADGLGLESPKKVKDFLEGSNWTYASIEKRQQALAKLYACKAWALA